MKILISGAFGFLGKHIFSYLNNDIFLVHTIGRSPQDTHIADLTNEFKINVCYDLIIHAAGIAHFVTKNKEDASWIYETNMKITSNLLNSIECKPKYFVFISSVSVYGITEGNLINEDFPLTADDPYGKSKIDSEQLVIDWCKKYNITSTILRLPLIVGDNPPGNLGDLINSIKKGYYFNIDNGKARKSMVLASDIAKHILVVSKIGGIYNLTDGYNPSIYELSSFLSLQNGKKYIFNIPKIFAKLIALLGDIIGTKFPLNSKRLSKIISTLTFDDSKAKLAFGWNPTPILKSKQIL